MTITVDLAPEIEKAIEEAAARHGQEPGELASEIAKKVLQVFFLSYKPADEIDNSHFFRRFKELLKEHLAHLEEPPATKGAELLPPPGFAAHLRQENRDGAVIVRELRAEWAGRP